MNAPLSDQEVADTICRTFQFQGQHFQLGQWIAILDGKVVAIENEVEGAVRALRKIAPDVTQGMLAEVCPPAVDVIRWPLKES